MRGSRFLGACVLAIALATGCNDSSGFTPPGPRPQIVNAIGPKDGVVTCADNGGACPLSINVTFRLAQGSLVTKALVRFQGDGTDAGVDRDYGLPNVVGQGETVDVPVTIAASVPPTILRRGALFTYSIRLVTGAGDESTPTTLTVSVAQ